MIVFKNYRFKEYKATSDQVNGESFTYESSMKYFSRIISLPKGWKSVLVEPGTYTFPRAKLDAFLSENNIHVTVPTLSIEGTVYDCQTDNNSSIQQPVAQHFDNKDRKNQSAYGSKCHKGERSAGVQTHTDCHA